MIDPMPSAPSVEDSPGSRSASSHRSLSVGGSTRLMIVYALTVFLSAFLLFQVQPLIGKFILPWFGGMTGVWTTCMLFFQLVLFGGYAYAHYTSSHLAPKTQAIL